MTSDLFHELQRIEVMRQKVGVTREALERTAMIAGRHYTHLLAGRYSPRRGTVNALHLALDRLKKNRNADVSSQSVLINMAIRFAIALICEARGIDAAPIQNSNPAKRATQSPEWLEASLVRRDAWALVSNAFGVSGSDLARAAGVSKAAISLALGKVEDARDDKDFDREMERLERALTGGGW